MTDEPIRNRDYLIGVNVVDIGEARVSRGESIRPPRICKHRNVIYDQNERRIWCSDCETTVEAFDMFVLLVEQWDAAHKQLKRRSKEVSEAESFALRSRAAKALDKEWRRKSTVPCCPHCSKAILPEDIVGHGMTCVSKEMERARRNKGKGS